MGKIFYIALPLEVPTRPAGSMVAVDGNGESLHLRGWGTLKFDIVGTHRVPRGSGGEGSPSRFPIRRGNHETSRCHSQTCK